MAEISREEAIKALNTIALASMFARECKPVSLGMTFDEIYEYLKKAISDMEKMQKVEEVIDNSTFHPNNYMASVELLKIIKEIEQIVKEVE